MADRTEILNWLHIGDLHTTQDQASLWETSLALPGSVVRVRARDAEGRIGEDRVEPAGRDWSARLRHADGSDANRVGVWPEKGIFDTQLGPNRNGRKW